MAIGESRTELLQWLNSELDLQYTKVEQCGSGAAYCQLMDSIVGGVPMSKVKFDTRLEYDYRSNMKILQAAFNKHRITKPIEVERLIKCRLQDNLELLQWFKKYWMENKDVHATYDAQSRRTSSGGTGSTTPRSTSRVSSGDHSKLNSRPASRTTSGSSVVRTLPKQRRSVIEDMNVTPTTPNNRTRNNELVETMQALEHANEELAEYKVQLESMETERNFYFNKLIEIESLIRNINSDTNKNIVETLTVPEMSIQIQQILYSTEEGFQVGDDLEGIDSETF
ncbi:protein Bim1p [[Candida] anglica]|uniref:Protein Bim1p n=1 Tax=[Candida] anglica TaxID=148631 RepID=A0ABP0ED43_9ASCO